MEGTTTERVEKVKLLKKEIYLMTCLGYKAIQKVLPYIFYCEHFPNGAICLEFKDKQKGKAALTFSQKIPVEMAVELGILKPLSN